MKLSIIVPVYNVEKYLFKCLNSILNQDLSNYEVIIINDGSKDNSKVIAEQFCNKHKNFFLYTKENGGLSSARNFGLSKSKGKYVYFLDSDDYLEANTLNIIIDEVEKNDLDGIAFDFRKITEKGIIINKKNHYRDVGIISGYDFLNTFTCISNVWLYLYKKDILLKNKITFMNGIYHEDELFTPQAILVCQKFKFLNIVGYNYIQRNNSIMTDVSLERKIKRFDSKIIVLSELIKLSSKEKNKKSSNYHPVDKKIEDLVIALAMQSCARDGLDSNYKRNSLKHVLPPKFVVKLGNKKKKVFWLIYYFLFIGR